MTITERHPVTTPTPARSPGRILGWVLTGLVSAFLAFDATIHLINLPVAQDGAVQLGFDPAQTVLMGAVEAVCLLLYLVPRTSVLGALFLTAYLGGAFTAQLRVHAPLWSTQLFPVYTAVLVWGGLWLRSTALRALVPLRRA